MTTGFDFLIAAKQREIAELRDLAHTSDLVALAGRLVHELQKERGASNVYLGSAGQHFSAERERQAAYARTAESEVRRHFDALLAGTAGPAPGSRLFGQMAYVVQALDGLDDLRARIAGRSVTIAEATQAFVTLIAGLLAVVFEAIDGADSPEISRLLVALLNFMQGKEYAGQERALGSGFYAAARITPQAQRELVRLIEAQERCFDVFTRFSTAAPLQAWQQLQRDATLVQLEQMRRMACMARADDALAPDLGQRWFDCCTQRIDMMKTVEDGIEADLHAACDGAIAAAEAELHDHQRLLESRAHARQQAAEPVAPMRANLFFPEDDGTPADPGSRRYGRQLERSMLELVVEQSTRLQAMREELAAVRAALDERKVIERAKGVLMAAQGLSEDAAYRRLRQTAMNENRRLVDVAAAVLAVSDYLVPRAAPAGRGTPRS